MHLHGPWELLGYIWDGEGLLGVNMQVHKSQSREESELGTRLFLERDGHCLYTVGVYWLFLPVLHVCLPSQPIMARREGGSSVNKCLYYGIALVCVYSTLASASLLEPSVLHSADAGLCQQSSVLASVLGVGVPDWCKDWWGCCPISGGSRYVALGQEKRLPLFFQTFWLHRYLITQVFYDCKDVLAPHC